MAQPANADPKLPRWFEVLKSAPAILRDFAILIVLAYAFFTPNAMGNFVCTSGLSEVGFFGVSAKANCEVKETLQMATQEVQSLAVEQRPEAPVSAVVAQKLEHAKQVSPESVPSAGWLFLGQRLRNGSGWKSGRPNTVEPIAFPVEIGSTIVIRDDVYLRDDTSGARSSARIVSVARVGERYRVLGVDETKIPNGDPFVWARVTKVAGS